MKILNDTKNLKCDGAVKCIFNLNELDIKVYKELTKEENIRADELAEILKKERSTVYRSLQKLTKCGICIKQIKNLEKGGYFHTYSCSGKLEIKRAAEECLEEWYQSIKKMLSQLNE